MRIYIKEESLEFDNNPKDITEYFEAIKLVLEKKEFQLSHLVIDGIPIYEDFHRYFMNNIENIKEVIVEIQTTETLVNETIVSSYNYLNNAITQVKLLSQEFYQRPEKSAWENLNHLFGGIQWIIETITKIDVLKDIDQIINCYEVWNEYVQNVSELKEIIVQIEEAMVNKDNILVGDLLLYEIVSIFEKMTEKLRLLLPKAVNLDVS